MVPEVQKFPTKPRNFINRENYRPYYSRVLLYSVTVQYSYIFVGRSPLYQNSWMALLEAAIGYALRRPAMLDWTVEKRTI